MNKYDFVVERKNRLLKFLTEKLPMYSYQTMQKALRKKDVIVNNQRINYDTSLCDGDVVRVYLNEKDIQSFFEIVYEDENIIIVNKKIGIEVCDGEFNVKSILEKEKNIDLFAAHRIDRNTIGLVIFAKNEYITKLITQSFKNHSVIKNYYAVVKGMVPEKQFDEIAYLLKDKDKSEVKIFDKKTNDSMQIETKFHPIKFYSDCTLVDVELTEGKTHQIRAHLAHLNFPLVGDEKYGDSAFNKIKKVRYQLLQAYKISFFFDEENDLYYLNNKVFELPCLITKNL